MATDTLDPQTFAMGTVVYAQRKGEILILKRVMGALAGTWYLPGGVLDRGETLEQCAERELREETGLVPGGPLRLVGLMLMPIYGHEVFIASYACDCERGDIVLSEEHSDARWIRPEEYRREFFSEENVRAVEAAHERVGRVARGIQRNLDSYLAWREDRDELERARRTDGA